MRCREKLFPYIIVLMVLIPSYVIPSQINEHVLNESETGHDTEPTDKTHSAYLETTTKCFKCNKIWPSTNDKSASNQSVIDLVNKTKETQYILKSYDSAPRCVDCYQNEGKEQEDTFDRSVPKQKILGANQNAAECASCKKTNKSRMLSRKRSIATDDQQTLQQFRTTTKGTTKDKLDSFDTTNITSQCFLCRGSDVIGSINSKNISHLFEGSVASQHFH